jgi:DNA polymerase III subunit delta'
LSSADSLAQALDGFRRGLGEGRVAHAYVLVGPVRGAAMALAESMLGLLFCAGPEPKPCGRCPGCRHVRTHAHADVLWMEPESKSRAITIDRIREQLLPRIGSTSFEGGWKAAVILNAERMNEAAANCFLKTLEEPPPRTLLLLLSDAPQFLLPTILSRCQKILLGGAGEPDAAGEEWRERVLDVLAGAGGGSLAARMAAARQMKGLLDEAKKAAAEAIEAEGGELEEEVLDARTNARLNEMRRRLLETVLAWQRDLLVLALHAGEEQIFFPKRLASLRREAARLDYAAALSRVRRAEDMVRQFDRNMSPDVVFWAFFRDLPQAPLGVKAG